MFVFAYVCIMNTFFIDNRIQCVDIKPDHVWFAIFAKKTGKPIKTSSVFLIRHSIYGIAMYEGFRWFIIWNWREQNFSKKFGISQNYTKRYCQNL